MALARPTLLRFAEKVLVGDDCWIWTAQISPDGYARFYYDGVTSNATRFIFQELVRPLEPGEELDHLCRNRGCVNPSHLDAVSHLENMRRGNAPGVVAVRTGRCKRGHADFGMRPNGKRYCRTCRRERRKVAA